MSKFMLVFSSCSWVILSLSSPLRAAELGVPNRYQWNDRPILSLKNSTPGTQDLFRSRLSTGAIAQGFPPDPRSTGPSGPCSAEQSIIPVVPITPASTDLIYRKSDTTLPHPSFWFYIPYSSVASAEFTLTEWQKNKPISVTSIEISETPGVIRIQIPTTTEALQDRKWYEAKLSVRVRCRPRTPLETESVRSWVRRNSLTPELSKRINQLKTPLQKAIDYAEAGFWYDALKILDADGASSNTNEWSMLLKKYGLKEKVIGARRVNCCNPTIQETK